MLKFTANSFIDLTQLPVGILKKFFHFWKADNMAGHCGLCTRTLTLAISILHWQTPVCQCHFGNTVLQVRL